jgi:hypothetical protein
MNPLAIVQVKLEPTEEDLVGNRKIASSHTFKDLEPEIEEESEVHQAESQISDAADFTNHSKDSNFENFMTSS